ncbi:MAG: DUF502 domain-containing protein [Proteobacteria bacterium]|nr:DUF502 domain-containing protein [Pseudomonadota bacterium]NQW44562.1 DUF502 domain-containing protein [Deltaproteobacteria bacterium]
MKQLRTAMLTGVLVLAPLMATINILRWLIVNLDATVSQYLPAKITHDYPGLGLVSVLLLILIIGALTQNYVGQWLVNLLDSGVKKLPLIGSIYSTIKKFLATIVNPGSDKFSGVVLVQFPRNGVYSIGFRTGKPDARIIPKVLDNEHAKFVNVFVPCTPNPTSGFYLWVKEEDVTPLDISVQEAFKTVVSMGIVSGEDH